MARYIEGKENKTDFIKSCIQKVMLEDLPRLEWGSVFPASRLKKASIPFFDIGIVAGFPVPLDNDERAQDIDLLRMLCPHPESSYLIRVEGHSMKDAGIWFVGTSDHGDRSLYDIDFKGGIALVMGAEGDGMRRLTEENCDFLVRIPMAGKVPCLNVSVATGVCLYEAVRQRAL